uniref:Uncharacterized protein n=1 Tax=Romanomermis culicivorax TaxID=13658 RepID=A0A915K9A0_ROMCU
MPGLRAPIIKITRSWQLKFHHIEKFTCPTLSTDESILASSSEDESKVAVTVLILFVPRNRQKCLFFTQDTTGLTLVRVCEYVLKNSPSFERRPWKPYLV